MKCQGTVALAAALSLTFLACSAKEVDSACTPADETCDGIDNDCDGEIDEAGCETACTPGASQCAEGKLRSCGAGGVWGDYVDCPGGTCADAKSCAACANACAAGATACVEGKLRTCQSGADGCLAWGPETACANGTCADATNCGGCEDRCPRLGATSCANGRLRSCEPGVDGCLAWSAETACASGSCADASSCGGTPTQVVISELLYDSAGSPDLGAFVELAGAVGTSLEGLTLVGVNGNGGADYNAIALSGTIPSDGLFLIAHPNGPLAASADLRSELVDFQNGPDSVQLRRGATVLDAVGYDTFGATDVFAGESAAARDTPVGWSLSRDASLTDSGNNANDFALTEFPTPGARNCPAACPAAGATECTEGQLRSCAADANGCLVWSAYSACPQGQCADARECLVPCVPDCDGRECGDDGCEGVCGQCLAEASCSAAGQCQCAAVDADQDGHFAVGSCGQPADDCDDTKPAIHPGAAEVCNNLDDDCDGTVDGLERPCSASGPCAAGVQQCRAGRWGECSVSQPEICGNGEDDDCDGVADEPGAVWGTSPVLVASGTQPRIAALDDGFAAAWISAGHLFLQKLDSTGSPVGSPVQQATTRAAYLVDLVRYADGLGLAWAEKNADGTRAPSTTFACTYGTDLVPASAVHTLPVGASLPWFWTEELRLGTANAGASFVIAERAYVDERNPYSGAGRGNGQYYRTTVIPFANELFAQEFFFDQTGSQEMGDESMLSIASLADGFVISWQPFMDGYPFDPVKLRAFDSERRPTWGPVGADPYAYFASAIVHDGSRIVSMSYETLGDDWAYTTFDPANGQRSATVESDSSTSHRWYSCDAAHLGGYSGQLLESATGNLNFARFGSTGTLVEQPTAVVSRASGLCRGQCARMAVTPQQIGVLYSDEGQIRFQRICR